MPSETPDRGSLNAHGQMARPVAVPWTCAQTGDCCRTLPHLTVTEQERELLDARIDRASRPLTWTAHPDPKFMILSAAPCPFLTEAGQCGVYDERPYNCRRFLCGRVDVAAESFELGGPMGCFNLSDRIATSLRFQHYYEANERRAQKAWASSHGWTR